MSSTIYDRELRKLAGLTWLPWVGCNVAELPISQRILVVGESHYSNELNPTKAARDIRRLMADAGYTRDIITECPVNLEWRNPTLENIERFLLGGPARCRVKLWDDLLFYNFVQRPMAYGHRKERPVWDDWVGGWRVFYDLVRVLEPAHCIFIGVSASHAFEFVMGGTQSPHKPVRKVEKVRRTWGRSANVTVGQGEVGLSFMRHCGAHFSWGDWHRFLDSQCNELIQNLRARHI